MNFKVNVNEYVYVQLTEDGINTYHKFYADLGLKPYRKIIDGWNKFQLWELMNIFGAEMYNGGKLQFKNNIILFMKERPW